MILRWSGEKHTHNFVNPVLLKVIISSYGTLSNVAMKLIYLLTDLIDLNTNFTYFPDISGKYMYCLLVLSHRNQQIIELCEFSFF